MSRRLLPALAPFALLATVAQAGTPDHGTLSLATPSITYTAGPVWVTNPTSQVGANTCFDTQFTCDVFTLTVDLPDDYPKTHPYGLVSVSGGWMLRSLDFEVFTTDDKGNIVAGVSSSNDPELSVFPPLPGKHVYQVQIYPNIANGDTVNGKIELVDALAPYPQSGPALTFDDHKPPQGIATDAGEPSIAIDLATGKILFESSTSTYRVTLDETKPGVSTWEDVSSPYSATTLDPILAGDRDKNRIFVSQLMGATSLLSFSDDDGETWLPSEGSGIPGGVDHQTVGSGPYPAPLNMVLSQNPLFGNAVYYCSQDLFAALCARSDDGGATFTPPVAIYTSECAGIHGHVKVAPDGTVYVPNRGCQFGDGAVQSAIVSEDAGTTWSIRPIPTAKSGQGWDPSIGIGKDGTVYFGYEGYDGHAHIAVSHDRGVTWVSDTDVSAPVNVQNTAFPAVVAGDGDRAAFAFHGSVTRGSPGSPQYPGEWYLYIATTFDGGQHWLTQNATPGDPVQRAGGICGGGITCGDNNRNLLDFMDAAVDGQGRIVVGYADGCIGNCVAGGRNSFSAQGSIVRQKTGPRLFHEFDTSGGKLAEGTDPAPLAGGALSSALLLPLLIAGARRRRPRR